MSLFLKSAALVLTALALCAFLFARLPADAKAPAPPYDLLITNARIVDGSGNPWFRADVAIKDGRIARIGRIQIQQHGEQDHRRSGANTCSRIYRCSHARRIDLQPARRGEFRAHGCDDARHRKLWCSATEVAEFLDRINEKPLAVNLATLIASWFRAS